MAGARLSEGPVDAGAGEFYVQGGEHTRIAFTRNKAGEVTGAVLNPGRWQIVGDKLDQRQSAKSGAAEAGAEPRSRSPSHQRPRPCAREVPRRARASADARCRRRTFRVRARQRQRAPSASRSDRRCMARQTKHFLAGAGVALRQYVPIAARERSARPADQARPSLSSRLCASSLSQPSRTGVPAARAAVSDQAVVTTTT